MEIFSQLNLNATIICKKKKNQVGSHWLNRRLHTWSSGNLTTSQRYIMIPEAPLWKHGASQPYLKTAALVERKWHLPNVHEVPNHVHAIVWEQWSWGLSQCLIDRKVFFFHSSEDSVLPFCMLLISESSSLSQLGHPKLCYTGCKQPSDFRGPKEGNKWTLEKDS